MNAVIFDIETGGLPLEQLQSVLPPFDRNSMKHPGQFDPKSVKVGNLGEAKANEKIDKSREDHTTACVRFQEDLARAEACYWTDIQDKAALSAVTGQVVAIGYLGRKETLHLAVDGVSERALLVNFWKQYLTLRKSSRPLVGFNIKAFDIPFLAQRSWSLNVEVPASILTPTGYLDSMFVDLMDRWKCGVRGWGQSGHGTLNAVCKSCGLSGKPSDCTGADFAKMLWSNDPAEREIAVSYLRGDLTMTAQLAERLGIS